MTGDIRHTQTPADPTNDGQDWKERGGEATTTPAQGGCMRHGAFAVRAR